MISKQEIKTKADEFGIHTSNVQRDYVFGWLIAGILTESKLGETYVLKGGNALRKGYMPTTRFSDDIDLSTAQGIDSSALVDKLIESGAYTRVAGGR